MMVEIKSVTVKVDNDISLMEVFLFKPKQKSAGLHPGILLAQHIPMGHTGLENDTFTLSTAQRLADNGYHVAVPFIFHWWPKSASLEMKKNESRDDWIIADMHAGFNCLMQQNNIDPHRIGLVGHCWGGRVAWLAACHIKTLRALAVFYGGNINKILGQGSASPLAQTNKISCPMIGFFGNDDTNPSPEDVEGYREALLLAKVTHVIHQYDGAGHAFQNFPAEARFHPDASDDAWEKLLVFLAQQLI